MQLSVFRYGIRNDDGGGRVSVVLLAVLLSVPILRNLPVLTYNIFSSGASLLTVALTVLLVNSRQSFYSLTFLKDFNAMGKRKLYMIHSMTDETYAVNTTLDYMPEDDKHSTMFGVALFSHFYWTFFSVLGSVIGQLLPFQLEGVDFCMTALFVIIFIDKWEHADRHSPALIGLGVGVLCLLIFGQNSFMLPALLLSTALLLLITNTNFGKKKGGKDNDEVKRQMKNRDSYFSGRYYHR